MLKIEHESELNLHEKSGQNFKSGLLLKWNFLINEENTLQNNQQDYLWNDQQSHQVQFAHFDAFFKGSQSKRKICFGIALLSF